MLRAAQIRHIVGMAVIGRTDGDDRLQRLWPQRRNLQTVESAPGYADDPDRTRTPGLRCQPCDDGKAVVLLLRQIPALAQPSLSPEPRMFTRTPA